MKKEQDILIMLASLSNHEIFTPPHIANSMLDLLPKEVFKKPEYKFLDPGVKTGVFLREIVIRLNEGLKGKGEHIGFDGKTYNLNDKQERLNHILKNMVFGIAISELTGYISRRTLYGVMEANSEKFNSFVNNLEILSNENKITEEKKFKQLDRTIFNDYYDYNMFQDDENYKGFEKEGNIFYPILEVDEENEDIFFPFIDEVKHTKINEIKQQKRFNKITNKEEDMKFDVIIGNPPYQINDGGGLGANARPIYHLFVENAIKMNPNYISMIIPSRWMTDGRGLNTFRKNMLNDNRISKIVDFKNAKECFPTVEIKGGINYFLWDIKHNDLCKYNNIQRNLSKYDIFIRNNKAISILEKININKNMFQRVQKYGPFANINEKRNIFKDFHLDIKKENCVKYYGNKLKLKKSNGIGFIPKNKLISNLDLIEKHKVLIPKANGNGNDKNILSQPIYAEPNSVCSETYLIVDYFDTKKEAENLIKYIKTKFFRFLVSLRKNTQNTTKYSYAFVPILDMNIEWTDEMLYKKYNLTEDEINYIETSIKEMK